MRWYFQVRVGAAERAVSRILQVLETQRVLPQRFEARQCHGSMHMQFVLECDDRQAERIGFLLLRAFAVESAYWTALHSHPEEQRIWRYTAFALQSPAESDVDLDPASPWWRPAPSTLLQHDNRGIPVPGHDTEVRMRWTSANLYLLFDCAYRQLHLRPSAPVVTQPTPSLWEHDVAELFLAAGADTLQRYMEFEVSPRGEWLALDITASAGDILSTAVLHSGCTTAAELDFEQQRWRAFLRVPLAGLADGSVADLRFNLFRSQGQAPVELAWQPTHHISFHVPACFGYLRLLPA